jgi:hypothetical protein
MMAPPPPLSSISLSSPRRFSSSFISGALSTAASPLQSSFNLTCRSPIRPTYDADVRQNLSSSSGAKAGTRYSTSPYLEPPSFLPISSSRNPQAKESWGGYEDETASVQSDESPTDQTWFLQPSPGLPPDLAPRRDEGKLGVISAINIIFGKTVGVGAYSVPSAIFAGVGSVGMTLLLWVIGSLISFCGLAVYLVQPSPRSPT